MHSMVYQADRVARAVSAAINSRLLTNRRQCGKNMRAAITTATDQPSVLHKTIGIHHDRFAGCLYQDLTRVNTI